MISVANSENIDNSIPVGRKNKGTAIVLSFLFGWLGMENFYLAKPATAFLKIGILFTTFIIPAFAWLTLLTVIFLWLLSFFGLCFMTEKEFNYKFNYER